jgi:hypothetical protein
MTHDHRPGEACTCCGGLQAQDTDDEDEDDTTRNVATRTTADLRRARQRARESLRTISDDVDDFLQQRDVSRIVDDPTAEQRVNEQLTRLIQQGLMQELLQWLDSRRKVAMGRAARASFDRMQTALTAAGVSRDLLGSDSLSREDRQINRMLSDVDAGLLTKLSDDAADRVTRQIRLGFQQREDVREVGRRVDMVLVDGDDPDRQKKGVSGQTIMSKGELIAHDSIQDAYNHSSRRRYLKNGFRYATFDAVVDFKTSQVCRRMNEVLIDMVEDPHLVPPLHPWCRSDIRPTLNRDEQQVTTDDDIADGFLQTIYQTKSYRTPEPSETYFRPTSLTRQGPDPEAVR